MPNRLICDVFREMRDAHEHRNYGYMKGLIEEAQTLANRMEAKLYDQKDFVRAEKAYRKHKKALKKAGINENRFD